MSWWLVGACWVVHIVLGLLFVVKNYDKLIVLFDGLNINRAFGLIITIFFWPLAFVDWR